MNDRLLFRLITHFVVACVGGILLGVVIAIIFWNNDDLFMWHWASVPVSMLYMGIAASCEFIRSKRGELSKIRVLIRDLLGRKTL